MDNAEMQPRSLELWGGLECTVNRVRDGYQTQLDRNGHHDRPCDIDRFQSLGIKAIRYPILWERHAPDGLGTADWEWADERLEALRKVGITPVAGLVHHGSGPLDTNLLDPGFAEKLAVYAAAVAARYPWVEHYTPVNEPCTTARFAGLYGVWYPHGKSDRSFISALLNQCKATVLAMREIRKVNPDAKLVQTDDLGKSYGTPEMQGLAEFYNDRRWLTWDLLCGRVDEAHPMWTYLVDRADAPPEDVLWFRDNPCPPDVIGVNYYITSERWLDHRAELFPEDRRGVADGKPCADIECPRVLSTPTAGIGPLIMEVWERYGIPIAVTEAHIDANREDQMRWLLEVWDGAKWAQSQGADVRGVTVWSLLGAFDWNCLVTEDRGYYEPGPYDVRSVLPRPTALAALMRELSAGTPPSHPVLRGQGWWRMNDRFLAEPIVTYDPVSSIDRDPCPAPQQPILITGATGTLGAAFARICHARNLTYRLMSRQEMDIADTESVTNALDYYKPWAVINCSGYVRIDEAESDAERCVRENSVGPIVMAALCRDRGIHFTTFSTDMVFDGTADTPYRESDMPRPVNVYGKSKRYAEEGVLRVNPAALVIRTSSFFGPWDDHNFATKMLRAFEAGEEFEAFDDVVVSPTYVPDLVNVCLDLAIDGEKAIWHLSNETAISWADFAARLAARAGIDARIKRISLESCGLPAKRPLYTPLESGRAVLMPTLDAAIDHYLHARKYKSRPLQSYFALES